jgi:choline dehydrogenase-like flavoprotein
MTTLLSEPDCIVIGSGPAGVSAACALVDFGVRVLMVDGAPRYDAANSEGDPPHKMLGRKLEALLPEDGLSPKLRTPAARKIAEDFSRLNKIRGDGFVTVGSMARGGLSRLWGGLVCEFDANDIRDWPISIGQLQPSYKAVTERIGVSGSDSDDMAFFYGHSGSILPPPELGPSAARLLDRFRRESFDAEFGLGLARNAILTIDRGDRHACDLRRDCLWGCPNGAVYDSRFDLAVLERRSTFQLTDDARATRLLRTSRGWEVHIQDGRILTAPVIVLAAGALSTAMLVIPLLPDAPAELPLLNNPVAAVPLLVPSRLGRKSAERG